MPAAICEADFETGVHPATQLVILDHWCRKKCNSGPQTSPPYLNRQYLPPSLDPCGPEQRQDFTHPSFESARHTRLEVSNYGFNCYPFGKMGHVSLDNQELRMWNELFRTRKDTTVKYCPPEVLSSAIARRQKAEGRRVQRGDNSPKKEQLFGGINLTINTGEFGAKSSFGVAQQLRSSPLTFEGSETENLRDYIIWLAEKGHVSFEHGRAAREALAREGWGFESLPTIEWEGRGGWIAMEIPPGVIRELLKKQKPWRDVSRRLMIEEEMRRQRGDNTPSVVELGSD